LYPALTAHCLGPAPYRGHGERERGKESAWLTIDRSFERKPRITR
jgi:hypothetical protein